MINWNSYVEARVHELIQDAESNRLLKSAVEQARNTAPARPLRERIGERLILLGWRMMNRQPEEGETCSRTVLSGKRQAIVMVEVCP